MRSLIDLDTLNSIIYVDLWVLAIPYENRSKKIAFKLFDKGYLNQDFKNTSHKVLQSQE